MLSHSYECWVDRTKADGKEYVHSTKDAAEYAASFNPEDYDIIAVKRGGEIRFCDPCLAKSDKNTARARVGDQDVCLKCKEKLEAAEKE